MYTPKNSREDMKLVSQKEMEHQFLRLGFRSGKQLHDEETRNSDGLNQLVQLDKIRNTEHSGMFRNVPCSGFYRRPWLTLTT